jgi:hypothetical protein
MISTLTRFDLRVRAVSQFVEKVLGTGSLSFSYDIQRLAFNGL